MNYRAYLYKLKNEVEKYTNISQESWNIVAERFTLKTFKKGELFVEAGKVCKYVGFNIQGIFREFFYHDGVEKTTDFIFKECFFHRM